MSIKQWFVLRVQPAQELTAEKQVRKLGYDAMAPWEAGSRGRGASKRDWKFPLFPGYLFASWPNWWEGWRRISGDAEPLDKIASIYGYLHPAWTFMPALLRPADVDYLQSIADGKFKREKHDVPRLKVGDQVVVPDGPFEGRTGTLSRVRGKKATVSLKGEKNVLDVEIAVVKLEKV